MTPPRIMTVFGASNKANPATGPVTALRLMIAALESEFEFQVLARPSSGLPNRVKIAPGWRGAIRHLRETPYDLLYLNSYFDREYTLPLLVARHLGLIPRRPTVIAPRGELLANAIRIKNTRKSIYNAVARGTGLLRDVWLHATSEMEYQELLRTFPWVKGIVLAEEICGSLPDIARVPRKGNPLRVVFMSRISEKKNLPYALKALTAVQRPIRFEIYGPIEEAAIWAECETIISRMPPIVSVTYRGIVSNDKVPAVFADADLFFLPTISENFGYAIFEALSCGVPVLISDQTPWRGLADWHAGWDLPLDDGLSFARVIDKMAELDDQKIEQLRVGARRRAADYLSQNDSVANNRSMFNRLIN